jgi:stage III sporulation protein AA
MFDVIVACLPPRIGRELLRIAHTRRGGAAEISELHMTIGRRSSVLIGSERVFLGVELTPADMDFAVHRVCGGAIYAHRDTISEGYVSLGGGVRVGICGQARYESDRLVGVSEVSSLVFRIPTASSSLASELYSAWQGSARGMLIYSPPGVGKTTALRTLVSMIAEGCPWERVAVVDERCEFSLDECRRLGVMLLRGYKRADGMEIALRTMSPTVIAVDEIGARCESAAMTDSLNSGVRLIATAHAKTRRELESRGGVEPFLRANAFDVFFGIFHTDAGYSCKIEEFIC